MIVVADSSPLRYLIVIGQQRLLPLLFSLVQIPSTVLDELTTSATPAIVRDLIEARPTWLVVSNPTPESLADVNPRLDAGERAALALAREIHADLVLIDDAAGRREARALGLRVTGTLGVLRVGAERALIDVPAVVADLRACGLYLDRDLIEKTFAEWL